ncbi:MAG: glycosyltransferase family 39 protein [Ignavibacteriaceae bacterium]|nr:glycosyltransferase family 39 protein [Ignavibacteriaceae bacterium]
MKKNKAYQFLTDNGLLVILLLAFIIRMIYFVSLQPWNNDVINKSVLAYDAGGYHNMALGLLFDHSFNNCGSIRTPVYPIFLAVCYLISGKTIWFALFVQIIINLLTLLLTYKIALEFFTKEIALISVLLLALDNHQSEFTVSLVTETLFTFIFISSIYFLCVGLIKRKKTIKYLAIGGCLLGLATLTRPITFLFPVAAVIFIVGYYLIFNKAGSSKIRFKMCTVNSFIYVVFFLLTISPWLYRNYVLYNEVQLTSITGSNLLFYNVAITDTIKTGRPMKEAQAYFKQKASALGADTSDLHSFKNSQIYSQMAIKYIKNNIFLYGKSYLKGMINLFYDVNRFSDIKTKPGITRYKSTGFLIYFAVIYFFTIIGVISSVKKKQLITLLFLIIIFYFDAITGVIGESRFRIPIMPFIYIFCSIGFVPFYTLIVNKFSKVKYLSQVQ